MVSNGGTNGCKKLDSQKDIEISLASIFIMSNDWNQNNRNEYFHAIIDSFGYCGMDWSE